MPDQSEEAESIFRWLADELSPDTFVNIMGQYRPEYEVGEVARNGDKKYATVDRRPTREEMSAARQAAVDAGLWRFDQRGFA